MLRARALSSASSYAERRKGKGARYYAKTRPTISGESDRLEASSGESDDDDGAELVFSAKGREPGLPDVEGSGWTPTSPTSPVHFSRAQL